LSKKKNLNKELFFFGGKMKDFIFAFPSIEKGKLTKM